MEEFYDSIIQFVNSLRGEHISLLEEENQRYCRSAEIMAVELEQADEELESILEDIVVNIKNIVDTVS